MKPTPTQRETPVGTNWLEEPRAFANLPEHQQSPRLPEYRLHWHQIRSRFSRQNRLLDWYN